MAATRKMIYRDVNKYPHEYDLINYQNAHILVQIYLSFEEK